MNPIVKNILAVVAGWLGGSVVNMGLIMVGHEVTPFPAGVDPSDMEALAIIMPSLGMEFFIFPFLAHALGTLVGATIAGVIAANHKMRFALGVGLFFLIGGIVVNIMLPGPIWFVVVDILLAYIPMAFIGGKIALKLTASK